MTRGYFISFEGGEGSGKSTQAKRLAAVLESRGETVVLTREPGGTPQGEALRAVLVSGDVGQWSASSEAMLMSAAREAHVRVLIAPALAQGKAVITDRFMDSTRAYQGHAGGCDMALIERLEQAAIGDCRPDLTFIFDLDPRVGLKRARLRGTANEDRFERKGMAFHEALRQGFLEIAEAEPQRCVLIDADRAVDTVFADVLASYEARRRG